MSESKKTESKKPMPEKAPDEQAAKSYATEKLLKSKEFAGYQQDFARVILTKPEYTVEEAKKAIDAVLKPGKDETGERPETEER